MRTCLDLFCGGGGAAVGYARAGFKVVGVDTALQRDYPFEIHRTDALAFVLEHGDQFDLIHASPPCQTHSITANLARAQGKRASTVNLIPATRAALRTTGKPYIIENVPGSPLIEPVVLCGSMFGLRVRRHRWFESNVTLRAPCPCDHKGQGRPVGVYGSPNDDIPCGGRTARDLRDGQDAMGIEWLPWSRLKEAIPPAYTEWLGSLV
jgi:DNA (cytosine-5)-methyltransferase 1